VTVARPSRAAPDSRSRHTGAEARRGVADLDAAADVVGFTIAEFIPRQVMHLRQILNGFPLI
jgi:arginase